MRERLRTGEKIRRHPRNDNGNSSTPATSAPLDAVSTATLLASVHLAKTFLWSLKLSAFVLSRCVAPLRNIDSSRCALSVSG